MIDWIKYLPLHFRAADPNCEFKGPNFQNARQISLIAAGNTIRLKAPRHSSNSGDPPLYVKNRDGLVTGFETLGASAATRNWIYSSMLYRSWDYRNSWFRGVKGSLNMHLSIVARDDEKAFTKTSFFHPRSFEFILSNYLNTRYGCKLPSDIPGYDNKAPVNWKLHHQLPVSSASFDVTGNNESFNYVFPISDTHFFKLIFSYIGYEENMRAQMKELARQIIDSVTLELGSQSQAQLDKVKAECPDMRLSESFAPLKWPMKPEEVERL